MVPSKRSRVANKNYSRFVDEGYYVDAKAVKKSKTKKRKLSDMLIPHWSKAELECFYEAYRRYGREWKKVAAKVHSKTPNEAEVLFNTFKSYLSLPEGVATAAGLIAMMTDHYNDMEEGNSDPDSRQVGSTSENYCKSSRAKPKIESSKGSEDYILFQSHSAQRRLSCLSLLRRSSSSDFFGGNQAHAVRKRTPRFPVSYFSERNVVRKLSSLKEQTSVSTPEDSTEKGIHVAALALARASQMSSFQEFSATSVKRLEQLVEYQASRDELKKVSNDSFGFQVNGGTPDAHTFDVTSQSVAAGEDHHYGVQEAYGRSEGVNIRGGKRKMEKEVIEETTPLVVETDLSGPNQLFSADEESALDALQALSGLELGYVQSKKKCSFFAGENVSSEPILKSYTSGSRMKRKKRNPIEEKILNAGIKKEIRTNEILVEEANKTCACQLFPFTDQGKVIRRSELTSSSIDVRRITNSAAVENAALVPDNHDMPISRRKKRKQDLQKEMSRRDSKSHHRFRDLTGSARTDVSDMKGELSNCLSSPLLRRWCTFEWFYSSIDYPWFARLDFVEYLNHVRLGHVPRLTQVEWSIIRSCLGKPRRLSQKYLLEERKKLEQYRESVRTHYAELRAGVRAGIATDLAKPLAVGQRVIARHPKTRKIHDGNVLTVDRNRYRVQFDKMELGVEFIMDTDCMPSNTWENLPDDIRRQNALHWLCNSFTNKKADNYIFELSGNHFSDVNARKISSAAPSKPPAVTKIQAMEDNISAHNKLTQAYKKKEALEMELRQMKEEASLKQTGGIVESEQFRKQYAMVLLQLREARLQLASALFDLGTFSAYDAYNRAESHVVEIVESSRCKAKLMVDNAMKVICSLNLAKDPHSIFEVASYREEPCKKEMKSVQHLGAADSGNENETTLCEGDAVANHRPIYAIQASDDGDGMGQILSELISASVATLLMIQACTERQYPPAEVAEILDCAVMRLKPRCSKNLPIYREIETYIGMIKSQMLALIPTRSNGNFLTEVSV